MKSGISINKINEMINEGLASAGGGEWTLLGKSSYFNNQIVNPIYLNNLHDSYNEILIQCEDNTDTSTPYKSHTFLLNKNILDDILSKQSNETYFIWAQDNGTFKYIRINPTNTLIDFSIKNCYISVYYR